MQRSVVLAIAAAGIALGAAAGSLAAGGDRQPETGEELVARLDGTIWCSPNVHTRVAVDRTGTVEKKEGKNICLVFREAGGHLIIQTIWWNVDAGIHVEEWAITLPSEPGRLIYVEAGHPEAAGFPGIAGEGAIVVRKDGALGLDQIGRLEDGSVAAFRAVLTEVDAVPEIPLERTYPAP